MDQNDTSTRARILDATMKLLYTTAPGELTTRRISAEAKVNLAAINYHFRSKDELVNRAMETATAKYFQMGLAVLFATGRPPRERLLEFLSGYAMGLVRFPGLTRTAFLELFTRKEGATFYGRLMKEMVQKVAEVIAEMGGAEASQDSTATALMVLSCVIFPFLLPRTMKEAGAVDYSDDEARRRYIDTALARLAGA